MTCAEARAALARSDDDARLEAHVAGCASCAAALDAITVPRPAPPADAPAGLGNAVTAHLAAESGPASWLRALPRGARLAGAMALAAALSALVILAAPREDLATYPLWRMGLLLGAHALVAALAAFQALRPLWLPPAPAHWALLLAGSAVAVSLLAGVLPELPTTARSPERSLRDAPVCLAAGLAAAALLVALSRPLDRGGTSTRPLLALAAAGVASDAALHLHCPHNERDHLALGHTGMVALAIGGALTWQLARRARRG